MLRTLTTTCKPRYGSGVLGLLRSYHSTDHIGSNLIVDNSTIESKILTKALEYIPRYGFKSGSITKAIRELDYPDSIQSVITSNPNGNSPEFQLTLHWLKSKRQELNNYALEDPEFNSISDEYERVAKLIKTRLMMNSPIIDHLQSGLSQLVVPYNMPQSLEELHNLSDDIAFLAGDFSHDFAWYAKRAGFSTLYVNSELYMLQDTSANFKKTNKFVDEKVLGIKQFGTAYTSVEEWGLFNAISLVNLVKSQLVRG
ncbi:Ubiquinone biosynthesis protein COQ9 mitochondrial [Spathaspora sp. JA1]|nr:Ubiquinone biosynthesis protein COQ9 mitochondrial [Spathaspora sp. JA1]